MSARRVRSAAVGVLTLGSTVVLGACGSSGQDATAATITIAPQSYQSKPPPTLEPEVTTAPTAGDDGTTDQVQTYTVQAGDYASTVAEKYGITLDELLAFNDWELVGNIAPDFPGPGGTVKIPAGAKFVDPNAPAEEDEEDVEPVIGDTTEDGSIIEAPPADIIDDASADRCVPGRYRLQTGDYPGQVANKFDVSVEAMAAANRSTPNYANFIVGTQIIIPAAEDC